ncbi:exo-alpha-sialidase [Kribbella sp. NPDC004875]|uniref:sialidase family protein n=1 Tax=Kribbella sp. NPDC004875 TaxID=3364107 RepID=UPI0036C5C086
MTTPSVRADGAVRPNATDPDLSEALIPTPCAENHASFLAWLPDGSLGCAWFGGSTEGRPDIYIYFSRLPAGADTWTEPVRVSRDDARSEQNPVLATLPNGDLWALYTAQEYGAQDTAVVLHQRSTDLGATWSEPETLFATVGTFIRQGVVQLGDKHWLLPIFHCHQLPGRQWRGDADTSAVAITENGGASWSEVEVPNSTGAVHMCIVALDNGELAGFFRSRWADAVYRSTSADEGKTWTVPAALDVPNNNSSIQVANAGGGVLLMVANPVSAPAEAPLGDGPVVGDKHKITAPGEAVPLQKHAVWGQPRIPLSLFSSRDAGLTWTKVLDLENEGTLGQEKDLPRKRPGAEMSYPTVVVDTAGDAHISYSYYRDAIKYVRVPRGKFA